MYKMITVSNFGYKGLKPLGFITEDEEWVNFMFFKKVKINLLKNCLIKN